jgi:hypothetical protein
LAHAEVVAAYRAGEDEVEQDQGKAIGIGRELAEAILSISRIGDEIPVKLQELRETLPDVIAVFDEEDGAASRL